MPKEEQKPDRSTIERHLRHITARWPELGQNVVLEVVHLTPDDMAKVKDVARFSPDEIGVSMAAEHIAAMNAYHINSYAVVNPIDGTTPLKPGTRASAKDIVASFYHWADGDSAESAQNIRNFVGPKCTFHVLTGSQPSMRPHVYWELEEPTRNLEAWSRIQKNIAGTLKTDPAVTDAPRIMRVAGTINWPKPQKQAKGYIAELTLLKIYDPDERPPVASERMARAFAGGAKADEKPRDGFDFDTGEGKKSAEEYADILRRARTDGEKHGGVRDLAASLAGSGVPRSMAEAIIRGACPVWDSGVEKLIETAYSKFYHPHDEDFTPNFDHPKSEAWAVQRADAFTADFVAPEYIIDGVIQRGRLYTFTAPTGSGKTAVMLYAASAIATGSTLCGVDVEHGDVLFMAGENPDDVRARVIATMEFYGLDPAATRLHFIAGTFSIRADMERLKAEAEKLPNLLLVVIDTFAAYFDGDDENSNAQALDFARVARRLTTLPSKPAVVMPAHPVKNATRQNLAPKGGSSLVNEVDGNLTLWNDSGILTMHWQVKFRGAEFEPLRFELQKFESDRLRDSKGRIMPTILAKPLLEMRATQLARDALSFEDKLLLSIAADPSLSQRTRCDAMGIPVSQRSNLRRALEKLAKDKLIKRFRTNWELTKDGERAVEMITRGDAFSPDLEE